ncbi:hypothetical protein [Staphylococcus massiliensis]|uniref:Uncharacterized protein n=1 Tax=Staphylococcus massiliensis S46 TaxID=1229783 RepID=K9ALJ9_9STAP|nr:hypothetical protein [Staphylococcus massiliensis]EKU48184.1 hypothetical protein C273_05742 [Staphylococcus massiliensis S46]MCG3399555.1 hypothetical protein [Staphylococcus massiliensis]MCG3402065.1 hypothetical protein [Staphylococcus massiliensis]MCG3412984.1 hypothetical protein [Staphylococcus massiliensis]POA00997.1 hypothetical protein CD133_03090 [Staphylococcus massiliensis CCUG 55927]
MECKPIRATLFEDLDFENDHVFYNRRLEHFQVIFEMKGSKTVDSLTTAYDDSEKNGVAMGQYYIPEYSKHYLLIFASKDKNKLLQLERNDRVLDRNDVYELIEVAKKA